MSVSTKISLTPNCVKFKIPSLEEGIKHVMFEKLTKTHLRICLDTSDSYNDYLDIPIDILGKEIIFQKTVNSDSYTIIVNKIRFTITSDELCTWHKFADLMEGTPSKPPINIGGDILIYENKRKVFRCGCKTINLKLANEIFHFIGKHLGYEIT